MGLLRGLGPWCLARAAGHSTLLPSPEALHPKAEAFTARGARGSLGHCRSVAPSAVPRASGTWGWQWSPFPSPCSPGGPAPAVPTSPQPQPSARGVGHGPQTLPAPGRHSPPGLGRASGGSGQVGAGKDQALVGPALRPPAPLQAWAPAPKPGRRLLRGRKRGLRVPASSCSPSATGGQLVASPGRRAPRGGARRPPPAPGPALSGHFRETQSGRYQEFLAGRPRGWLQGQPWPNPCPPTPAWPPLRGCRLPSTRSPVLKEVPLPRSQGTGGGGSTRGRVGPTRPGWTAPALAPAPCRWRWGEGLRGE